MFILLHTLTGRFLKTEQPRFTKTGKSTVAALRCCHKTIPKEQKFRCGSWTILFGDLTIDLIKMDVEGFELEVLKGAMNVLKAIAWPVLIIEVSEQREQEKGVSPKEIADFVKTIGNYQLFKQKGTKERRSKLIPILTDADLPLI